jgi:hypothetical protein
MSTNDTRTEAERRYDAERDGTLYTSLPADLSLDGNELELIQLIEQIEAAQGVDAAWETIGALFGQPITRPVGTGNCVHVLRPARRRYAHLRHVGKGRAEHCR